MFKKFICTVLAFALVQPYVFGDMCEDAYVFYADDEEVSLIVELVGEPVLDNSSAKEMGAYVYGRTLEAQLQNSEILQTQSDVCSDIMQINPCMEVENTYTNIFNGFSVNVRHSDIEEIASLPEVKNVYIAKKIPVPETQTTSEEFALLSSAELNSEYKGEGQVICVIDNEFDISHEMFAYTPDNPKLTPENIESALPNMTGIKASMYNYVYKSEKLPLVYDYIDADADTSAEGKIHGTHVASIAAGKNGVASDNTAFDGIAPEAQLVLMKVSDGSSIYTNAVLQALDDACMLDIDVINMSIGADYSQENSYFTDAIATARKSGINVCVSTGNAHRGYDGNPILTTNTEYFAAGTPGNSLGAFTVASSSSTAVSSFSSYGTNGSLLLEPDITAPGEKIYAAVPGGYAYKSGTSMASPHMAGIYALMNQHFAETTFDCATDKILHIENLLMSTAEILEYPSGTPFSPRVQGAGRVDFKSALETPVVLLGDNGSTKLSLYDGLTDNFKIEFEAKNLTDTDVTYDSVQLVTATDGYEYIDGKYYISDADILINSNDLPASVTVPAGSCATVSANISLDATQTSALAEIFTNGFYVDGYVILADSTDANPKISIPFTGYYGNWLDADFFDKPHGDAAAVSGNFGLISTDSGKIAYLGQNIADNTEQPIFSPDYAAISPNGDKRMDNLYISLSPLRDLQLVNMYLCKEDSALYKIYAYDIPRLNMMPYGSKAFEGLEDGEYTLEIYGFHTYDTELKYPQSTSLSFTVDTSAPVIKAVEFSGTDSSVLTLTLTDNHYVSSAVATDGTATQTAVINPKEQTADDKSTYVNLDISEMADDNIYLCVSDFACNTVSSVIGSLDNGLSVMLDSEPDFSSTLTGTYINTSGAPVSCLFTAGFFKTDILIGTVRDEITIPLGNSDMNFSLPSDMSSADSIKMFFWNENMSSLRKCISFSLSTN